MDETRPTTHEIAHYPQLAILDALMRTVLLSTSALVAAYEHEDVDEDTAETAYAHALIHEMSALQITLDSYRRALSLGDQVSA